MQKVLTAEEMREVDRLTTEKYGIPSLILMENAAHAAARVITEKLGGSVAGKSFLILCGKGNNGGDGAALGRILWTMGASVFVHLFGKVEETKGDARANFEILKKFYESDHTNPPTNRCLLFYEIDDFEDYYVNTDRKDVIVDALFGTGLTRPIESGLLEVIESLIRLKKRFRKPLIVSLDVPSGLNSDSAEPIGSNIEADLTVTFTAPKSANVFPPASRYNGELVSVDIGSPEHLVDETPSEIYLTNRWAAKRWFLSTKFTVDSYKKTRGHALVVAGSKNMSGAAVLCANAAMVSGVGLVTVAAPEAAQTAVASRVLPEVMVQSVAQTEAGAVDEAALETVLSLSEKMNAVAIGCGLSSKEETTRRFVRKFVEQRRTPVVIDADGLNALAPFDLQGLDELPLILTPHIGEMRRLMGVDETADLSDRVKIAREFAQKHHVILVLKGERSLIAEPGGKVVVNPTGNAGLGKAGNGDTLTGIITGFIAQTLAVPHETVYLTEFGESRIGRVMEAVVAALYISGLAGDIAAKKIGVRTMTASDVRECLADAFRELEN
jgi:ADP-dependent NAD(P)H-hydrate dehydratase / NAD(P)H-hydrate epimerase